MYITEVCIWCCTVSAKCSAIAHHCSHNVRTLLLLHCIYRYVCEDTLEPNIMELQEAKRALGSGALKKLTPEEARKVTAQCTTQHELHDVLLHCAVSLLSM
jgi:hypothetical protein